MTKYILVGLLIIIVGVGAYVGGRIALSNLRASAAQNASEKFLKKLYAEYDVVGMNCQGEDTDGDKYISCDARIKNAQNIEKVVHLQCPSIVKSFFGSSCKESRLTITQ